MNRFQIILSIVCGVALVVAIMIFSGFIPTPQSSNAKIDTGLVVVWGTLPSRQFSEISNSLAQKDKTLSLRYIEIPADSFKYKLTEAIADGTQPDLILYPNDILLQLEPRIEKIPYTSFAEGAFRQTYTEISETLITKDGLLGIPLANDPLVLFYNRDILSNTGFAQPIEYWDEVQKYVESINIKSVGTKLTRSTFALGLYDNVTNAKSILSTLLLQSGNTIVERSLDGGYKSTLSSFTDSNGVSTAETILSFYTRFSNPYDDVYSWNRSLPSSREAFLAGDLAYYFGFASELMDLRERNPNLNFAPTSVPQIRGTVTKATFGRLYIMSTVKYSSNVAGTNKVLFTFADPEVIKFFDASYSLSPVHRSTIAGNLGTSTYSTVFDEQSLVSKTWYDPSPIQSDAVFRDMINSIITGRMKIIEAILRAQSLLQV